jgi:O-methyltransferase involved in polyketide biosynthesis
VLDEANISIPDNLHFCLTDFQRESLADDLAKTSFDFNTPSVFSWLGVTQYLSDAAIRSTRQFIQSLPQSSTVVFSFLPTDISLPEGDRHLLTEIDRLATASGDPFLSRFTPEDIQQLLRTMGFGSVYHLLPEEAQERYFKNRADELVPIRAEQLIRATL